MGGLLPPRQNQNLTLLKSSGDCLFLYDFLAEYYRNLSIIKKNKFAIDNKSLYEHTFEMKMRYIYKNDFSGNKTIINKKI